MYTLLDLKKEFQTLKNESYQGIQGVRFIDSGKPGPTLLITACTHGNEPAGLAPIRYVREHTILPKTGAFLFIISNLKAADQYFHAANEHEKYMARFIDINMNRIPQDILSNQSDQYEIQRFHAIRPLLYQADLGLDIHSTSTPSESIIMPMHETTLSLIDAIPIKTVLTNGEEILRDRPLASFFGGDRNLEAERLLLETGQHEDSTTIQTAISCFLEAARYAGMFDHDLPVQHPTEKDIYQMCASIFFPSEHYMQVKNFLNFEPIAKGDLIAEGDGNPIFSPVDGCTLFGNAAGKPPSIKEEAMFFTTPKKTRVALRAKD